MNIENNKSININNNDCSNIDKNFLIKLNDENEIAIDFNNYHPNIGLGFISQELICDFYQTFSQEHPESIGLFEKILYSVIDDMQKYQKEIQRLENSYQREKEQNEKFLKHIEDEAENQLVITTEKIRNEEKQKWEIEREQLKETFRNEIAELQATVSQMETIEQKYINNKNDDDTQVLSLKTQINDLLVENRQLNSTLIDTQTKFAVFKSEMAQLKAQYEDKKHDYDYEKRCTEELNKEIDNLKQQVHILHEANKRLHDTNDDLRANIDTYKSKFIRLTEQENFNKNSLINDDSPSNRKGSIMSKYIERNQQINAKNKQGITSISGLNSNNHNHIVANRSFDADSVNEDLDSGLSTINGTTECETDIGENLHLSLNNTRNNEDNFGGNNFGFDEEGLYGEEDSFNKISRTTSNISLSTSPNNKKIINKDDNIELQKSPSGPPDRMFKIVFAGDAAVGKSSFIMRFCKGKFVSNLNSTLGVDFQMKLLDVDGKTTAIQLWDTCGQERFRAIAKSYFRRADGVILMYDCTYERSFLNVREWMLTIQDATDKKLPIILVSNKIDLRELARENGKKVVEYEDGLKLAKEHEALFIETSAKDGTNINESLIEIAKIMRCNEDIEVESSGIKLTWSEKKKSCCGSS